MFVYISLSLSIYIYVYIYIYIYIYLSIYAKRWVRPWCGPFAVLERLAVAKSPGVKQFGDLPSSGGISAPWRDKTRLGSKPRISRFGLRELGVKHGAWGTERSEADVYTAANASHQRTTYAVKPPGLHSIHSYTQYT